MNHDESITYQGVEMTVSGNFLAYDPGRTSGPPEDCYPPDGGYIEDAIVTIGEQDVTDLLDEKHRQAIEAHAWSEWNQGDRK